MKLFTGTLDDMVTLDTFPSPNFTFSNKSIHTVDLFIRLDGGGEYEKCPVFFVPNFFYLLNSLVFILIFVRHGKGIKLSIN